MTALERRTDLLMVGLGQTAYGNAELRLAATMKQKDPDWKLASCSALMFRDAVILAKAWNSLELVYVVNSTIFTHVQLAEGCEKLTEVLKAHRNHPRVIFGGARLRFLEVIFRQRGVPVHALDGSLEALVQMLWEEQTKPLIRIG